jgi:hypothetical protein
VSSLWNPAQNVVEVTQEVVEGVSKSKEK